MTNKFMIFDVESIGLHGEGYSVGWMIIDRFGKQYSKGRLACHPNTAQGPEDDRKWVAENIPHITVTHKTPKDVRDDFWKAWMRAKSEFCDLVADCGWPVEARFLIDCVNDDLENRKWDGPYPLHELATLQLAHGVDPLAVFSRRPGELPKHDPMADSSQSARLFSDGLQVNDKPPEVWDCQQQVTTTNNPLPS